jgi:hypothetical protein
MRTGSGADGGDADGGGCGWRADSQKLSDKGSRGREFHAVGVAEHLGRQRDLG